MATLVRMNEKPTEHVPVLGPELVALLDPQPGELAVDCTFGAGGHARLMAERLGPSGRLIAVDRDPAAQIRFEAFARDAACETDFVRADYADALAALSAKGARPDIVYFDLGLSSIQLDSPERGFSYSYDAPLDMRMDPGQALSALDVVNEFGERQLADVIRRFGEEPRSRAIAREIVARRPIATTSELVDAIREALPPPVRFGRGHPAKRTFQAIRIAVNSELDSLVRALPEAWTLLRDGGRFGAIAFHSLEDRPVKRFLAEQARGCVCPPELPVCRCGGEPAAELLSRRAVSPSEDEMEANPRSRSAHLRAARKLRMREETN
ncbi:MAG: 16S rRNA (cytosine(1402)-N(4))-methyltransferase RsmH, partial [Solirubrobacterales bacterium]